MRMTNKIMQNNSLFNINQTKINEDKYNTQLTSQSKITRPSDDPVIAIRALRLRSNVSTADQYYSKNAPDANQWLDVTAKSLDTMTKVYTDLYKQVETGVNKDYTASDMQVLLTQIENYTNEVYATGNQDYAGRYIFTGYRTDTPLTFQKEQIDKANKSPYYTITENIQEAQFDTITYTSHYNETTPDEADVERNDIRRIRLSYKNIADGATEAALSPKLTITMPDGTTTSVTVSSVPTREATYSDVLSNPGHASYNAQSGEIVLGETLAKSIEEKIAQGATISVEYVKNEWDEGDLNPQHYFKCTYKDPINSPAGDITYNADGNVDTQITYDVGYNQTIQVNTNAYEVFDPAVARDLDDLKYIVNEFAEIEKKRAELKEKIKDENDPDYDANKREYDAADKMYTFIRDTVSKRFSDQITRYQTYLDNTNVAITKNGTRSTRLELISERLEKQKSTFKELQEENEGIDMTEVAVLLTSAETTYDAALMATSKIMQNSLINYI